MTYQNISPSVTWKPWRVMSPSLAFGSLRGWYSGIVAKEDVKYVMSNKSNKMDTLLVDSSFRSSVCLAMALNLEPDLINMQNKYTRGWYNCLLCDITVSGGWYKCFLHDLAYFRVDSYIYYICDITWKLILKSYISINYTFM